jgi:hypothetical protein
MLCVAAAGCRVTFPLWQVWQSRHHLAASAAHPRHTNLLDTRRLVARIPGCASPWMAANTADLNERGRHQRPGHPCRHITQDICPVDLEPPDL